VSGPERSQLDVLIDIEWHAARFAGEPDSAALHWVKHNELVRQRAERESARGGLAGTDSTLPASGGIGVAGQLREA
jgi:hypothetical protein